MRWLIKGGTLVYGSGWKEEDILIEDGKIIEIRPEIKPYGEVKLLDAAANYILPGFIATEMDRQDGKSFGITTIVKSTNLIKDGQEGPQDCVFTTELKELIKSEVYLLAKKGIKVLQIPPGQTKLKNLINEEIWQRRLSDLGIVLYVPDEDYPSYESCWLPLVVDYGKIKCANRSQLVLHVKEERAEEWLRQARRLDMFLLQPYWLDVYSCPVPNLSTEEEIQQFLLILTKARSSLPAKLFGIYPQKGSLHIGGDADLMLVDKNSLIAKSHPFFSPKYVMIKGEWQNQGSNLKAKRTYAYL
jgi:hypothetical protein